MPDENHSSRIAKTCCMPASTKGQLPEQKSPGNRKVDVNMEGVAIPGGNGLVGTSTAQVPDDGESSLRKITLKPFRMAATTVTNAEFRAFVDETGYLTEAERFGWSFVFWQQVPDSVGPTQSVADVNWWRRVDGACWFAPNGPETQDACIPDHPVEHISWNDAKAYAKWVGGRLPTEAEWEHAARAGQGDVKFPWGHDEPDDSDFTPCNIWQGTFPRHNTAADGFVTTAPARSFDPNPWGLYNMVGNVWEWTSDSYRVLSLKCAVKKRLSQMKGYKVSKGGSFLCHRSYCY